MIHTKEYLKNKKQVRSMWSCRVALVERKTTKRYVECNAGFCKSEACWLYHVAICGVPQLPKKGIKKRNLREVIG